MTNFTQFSLSRCGDKVLKIVVGVSLYFACISAGHAQTFEDLIDRTETDIETSSPLIVHLTVALCTNRQKKTAICDENKASSNLYWGAQYGVKTYYNRQKEWERIPVPKPSHVKTIDRVLFKRVLTANDRDLNVYLLADAWRGGDAKEAITHFLRMSSGERVEKIKVGDETLYAGGESHVTAYMGHNGLANYSLDLELEKTTTPKSAIVLGRHTAKTFTTPLLEIGVFPLLTTNGKMTPEAYTLEAAIKAWFSTLSPAETRLATATAYAKFQKASLNWSKSLFITGDENFGK